MELPLRTDDAHGRCDLLSSTKQLLLFLCGDSSRVNNDVSHNDIQSPPATINNHIYNFSISTCSLHHAERWIQQQTFPLINAEMTTANPSFVSCSGYHLYDLRSKLHAAWLTITNNVPYFLINTKDTTDQMYAHRSDRLISKIRHISWNGEYVENYLNVSFSSLLVADTFWNLQQKLSHDDDSITSTNLSSFFYTNSTFLVDLTNFCIQAMQQSAANDCTMQLFWQLQLFYLGMKFI